MQSPSVISPINDALPEFQQYQHRFVDYIRNPLKDGTVPDSLPVKSSIYAKLLFSKIEGSLDNCFPISCQLLGSERWQKLIKNFISEHQCKSPLYREIPDEFIDYLMHNQSDIVLPEFIIELAHFEWMELVLETEKAKPSKPCFSITDNILDVTPALNPILHLLHYHYPVQNISALNSYWNNWESRSEPYSQEAIILVGLRDNNDKVQFIEINSITARLIELTQEGLSTGKQILLELAAAMHYGDHETILPFGTDMLKQLEQQHIIIGSLNE